MKEEELMRVPREDVKACYELFNSMMFHEVTLYMSGGSPSVRAIIIEIMGESIRYVGNDGQTYHTSYIFINSIRDHGLEPIKTNRY